MKITEEKLWEYIDGGGSPIERNELAAIIAQNDDVRNRYNELLQLNAEFAAIDLDEPPMAFTYNVMEHIRTQEASVPLKSGINKRIIFGIAAFFIITIIGLLAFALGSVHWSMQSGAPAPIQLNPAQVSHVFSGNVLKGFLFFDVVFGLFLLDSWLRNRKPDMVIDKS